MSSKFLEVDAHFHVWELDRFSYPWPNTDVTKIFRTISFDELTTALSSANVTRAVFVQVLNACPAEALWVLKAAEESGVIAGVVAESPAEGTTSLR